LNITRGDLQRHTKEQQVNPFLSNELAGERIRDIRDEADRTGRGRAGKSAEKRDRLVGVTVRRFADRDINAIRWLAALDDKPIPIGGVLVAEVRGQLVAALPLDGGEALADPFTPTADIVALLRLRARQLRKSSRQRTPAHPHWARGLALLRKAA
jgi:hypothetical protein